jgi:hypothetical protein
MAKTILMVLFFSLNILPLSFAAEPAVAEATFAVD